MTVMKDRLATLCKELQKNNKDLADERQSINDRVSKVIEDVTVKMEKTQTEAMAVAEENKVLRKHLTELSSSVEKREEYRDQLGKAYTLEKQLHEAQLKELEGRLLKSNEDLRDSLMKEKSLREQLDIYTKKFEDFSSTVQQSQKIFDEMRKHQDLASKKIKGLEKDVQDLKAKEARSDAAILEYHQKQQELQNRNAKLESLCRALQEKTKVQQPSVSDTPSSDA
eukprot:ANDGO_06551.mRNA.1 hypothetical protein SDRG_04346